MQRFVLLVACALLTALVAGNAAADELRGRVAVSGRIGVTNPANSEKASPAGTLVVSTDAGIIGGGGVLYGVDDNVALELDVTHSSFDASGFGTAETTNVSIGGQYRFPERQRLIPYLGAGADVLINDVSDRYADTVLGFHLSGGIDYMLTRHVYLNGEIKGVEALSSDVRDFSGGKVGELDPSNVAFTVGARFFFN